MIIDFDMVTSSQILSTVSPHSGGTNYALTLINALLNYGENKDVKFRVLIVKEKEEWIKGQLHQNSNCETVITEDLLSINYSNTDILFMPQVNGTLISIVHKIHNLNPKMKIYGTIHDRQHNIEKLDIYDCYYSEHPYWALFSNAIRFIAKKLAFNYVYKSNIGFIDKVFTVSNYSAQRLENVSLREIYIYEQMNFFQDKKRDCKIGEYILFVGGNRPEKNLVRTLEAYCLYCEHNPDSEQLIVTGVSDKLKNLFFKNKKLNRRILEEKVIFKNYVADDELADLYASCKYVLFLSKGEGYGLPVLEALSYGKAVLASRVTAIPEVGGAAVKYVNPYSVSEIRRGIEFFSKESNIRKYADKAMLKYDLICKNAELDQKMIISEIIEG